MATLESPSMTELRIEGMTCASCAVRIEKKLNKLEGVEATVNYATDAAAVSYVPARASCGFLDAGARRVVAHRGGVSRVVDRRLDAFELVELLLDPNRARGAGHAFDAELRHGWALKGCHRRPRSRPPRSPPAARRQRGRRRGRPRASFGDRPRRTRPRPPARSRLRSPRCSARSSSRARNRTVSRSRPTQYTLEG